MSKKPYHGILAYELLRLSNCTHTLHAYSAHGCANESLAKRHEEQCRNMHFTCCLIFYHSQYLFMRFFARHNLVNITDNDAMCCVWRSLRHKGSTLKGGSKKSTRNRCRAKARESALVYSLLCIGFSFALTHCRPAFRGCYAVPVDLSLGGDYTSPTAYLSKANKQEHSLWLLLSVCVCLSACSVSEAAPDTTLWKP